MPWANIITAAATLIAAYIGANLAQRNQTREFDRQAREKHRLEQRDVILALATAAAAAQIENERIIRIAEKMAKNRGSTTEVTPPEAGALEQQIQTAQARTDILTEEFRRARVIITDPELKVQVDQCAAHTAVYSTYVAMAARSAADTAKLAQVRVAADKHRLDLAEGMQLLSENAAVRLSPMYQPPKNTRRPQALKWLRWKVSRATPPPASNDDRE